jgi:hypothetical protein
MRSLGILILSVLAARCDALRLWDDLVEESDPLFRRLADDVEALCARVDAEVTPSPTVLEDERCFVQALDPVLPNYARLAFTKYRCFLRVLHESLREDLRHWSPASEHAPLALLNGTVETSFPRPSNFRDAVLQDLQLHWTLDDVLPLPQRLGHSHYVFEHTVLALAEIVLLEGTGVQAYLRAVQPFARRPYRHRFNRCKGRLLPVMGPKFPPELVRAMRRKLSRAGYDVWMSAVGAAAARGFRMP